MLRAHKYANPDKWTTRNHQHVCVCACVRVNTLYKCVHKYSAGKHTPNITFIIILYCARTRIAFK